MYVGLGMGSRTHEQCSGDIFDEYDMGTSLYIELRLLGPSASTEAFLRPKLLLDWAISTHFHSSSFL